MNSIKHKVHLKKNNNRGTEETIRVNINNKTVFSHKTSAKAIKAQSRFIKERGYFSNCLSTPSENVRYFSLYSVNFYVQLYIEQNPSSNY